ncbi:hypothetical protein J1614_012231 [Plenodomus biglobosus]|nr:hypothetical protein J1614_012231 [Plenodomus biglobosus]
MTYSPNFVAENQAALDHFIQLPVSQHMITYLAQKATQSIRCKPSIKKNYPDTPLVSAPQHAVTQLRLPSLEEFITSLVKRSHVQVPTLMSSLIYLSRMGSRLSPVIKDMPCTAHRIFLVSLILAAKNLNDSCPTNKHWADYSIVPGFANSGFSTTEVNLMEKQLLSLLNWDIRINPDDLYYHFEPFLALIRNKQSHRAQKARLVEERWHSVRQEYPFKAEAPSTAWDFLTNFADEYDQALMQRYNACQGANILYIRSVRQEGWQDTRAFKKANSRRLFNRAFGHSSNPYVSHVGY